MDRNLEKGKTFRLRQEVMHLGSLFDLLAYLHPNHIDNQRGNRSACAAPVTVVIGLREHANGAIRPA